MRLVYNVYRMSKESKLIRLDIEVYGELDRLRLGHESFSNIIWRLLQNYEQIRKMLKSLAGELPERK